LEFPKAKYPLKGLKSRHEAVPISESFFGKFEKIVKEGRWAILRAFFFSLEDKDNN